MEGQLHGRDTNERSREMKLVKDAVSLARNSAWEGWSGKVVIDEKGSVGSGESCLHDEKFVCVTGKLSMQINATYFPAN